MTGIFGYSSKSSHVELNKFFKDLIHKSESDFQTNISEINSGILGRIVLKKFLTNRVFVDNDDAIICFEGIQYNFSEENFNSRLLTLYKINGKDFIKLIKGNYSCFVYDKINKKIFLYTDHLSTKPIYYSISENAFFFASKMQTVIDSLAITKNHFSINHEACFYLAKFGSMIGNQTLVQEIVRARSGQCIEYDLELHKLTITEHTKLIKQCNFQLTRRDVINEIDRLFVKAVTDEWEKDETNNFRHFALLSGGLDSRCNIMVAEEKGFKDILTITFAKSGSLDEKIAREISNYYAFEHLFYSLDDGNYLISNTDEYVYANDGLNCYIGAAHEYRTIKTLNTKLYGLMHTGMIGDAVFGSFLMRLGEFEDKIKLIEQHDTLGLKNILQNRYYKDNLELFGFEESIPNGALNGDRSESHLVDITSPFYNLDLINFCLSIPDNYRYGEAIYIDWINDKHPSISNFKWERSGIKPKSARLSHYAFQVKRYRNGILKNIGYNISSMNPYELWLKKNEKIKNYLETVWIQESHHLNSLTHLNEIRQIYDQNKRTDRFNVITLLLALKNISQI